MTNLDSLNKLERDILEFVDNLGFVSFSELKNRFSEYEGNFEITNTLKNVSKIRAPKGSSSDLKKKLSAIRKKGYVLLWTGFSEEFINSFAKLLNEGYVTCKPTSFMTYIMDGAYMTADNWLPTTINITAKGREVLKNQK